MTATDPSFGALLQVAPWGLAASTSLALVAWVGSVVLRDASLVDRFWSALIGAAALAYAVLLPATGERAWWMGALLLAWALRLAVYISWRNWGHGEDRRYQAIRARNEPNFAFKSLYLVFALQAVIAWVVAMPFLAGFAVDAPLGVVDGIGAALAAFGIGFEAVADAQMARFKADPANRGQVMDRGLWRLSRHPNYFGEACAWWGLWLMAVPAGGAWSIVSPIVMTVLLLKVSGVTLLEKDIGERRSAYRDYVARTSAFIPRPPRKRRVSA
jgi:steroid 5-alpha reductase family enzyme